MVPGTEAYPGNWHPWIVGPSPMGLPIQAWFGTTFYSAMVYEDPKWDFKTFDLARDFAKALAKTGNILDSNDPHLGPFRARGGSSWGWRRSG
jgi:feruloyl esterase